MPRAMGSMRSMVRRLARTLVTLGVLATVVGVAADPAGAGGDWNDAGIQWQPYEKGLEVAKKDKKPVCLVFYTEWCPHCTNYSKVFHDPKVVEQSKQFVMIRVDKDKSPAISATHAPDGEYIPRTYFLSAEAKLEPAIHAPREKFKYFYDENAPGSLLTGMGEALKKLRP